MPNRTRPVHPAARCGGLVLGLLAQPGIGYGAGIEPDDQPQQQEDRGPITCVVSNDGYDVHFTAYARASPEDGTPGEDKLPAPFCQDLPATGPTHLTLDLMNREARTQPVAVRVVREGGDDPQAAVPKSPLLEVPSKIYPTGVVEADVGLDEPGEYAVLVDFDKGAGRGQVRIPLQVAQSGGLPTMIGPLIGALLAALVAAWLAYRRFGKSET
ncbi:MAG: hypothetical protein ACREXK_09910 [Gammaproteobacteria bacterium]